MKRILTVLALLLLSIIPSYAQSTVLKSPTYLGFVLIDEANSQKMIETCRYYHLDEQQSEDGFKVFTHEDGTKIRFKVNKSEIGDFPEVQIILNEKSGTISKILTEAGFKKQGSNYYRGSKFEHRRTKCHLSSGSPSILTLTKEYKTKDQ